MTCQNINIHKYVNAIPKNNEKLNDFFKSIPFEYRLPVIRLSGRYIRNKIDVRLLLTSFEYSFKYDINITDTINILNTLNKDEINEALFALNSLTQDYPKKALKIASILINDYDAGVNAIFAEHKDILTGACIWNADINYVKLLVENGANIEGQSDITPLMWASRNLFIPNGLIVMKYLIEKGANINAKDKSGGTVIDHILCDEYGQDPYLQTDAIKLLMSNNDFENDGRFNRHMENRIRDLFSDVRDLKHEIDKTRDPIKLLLYFRNSPRISELINDTLKRN